MIRKLCVYTLGCLLVLGLCFVVPEVALGYENKEPKSLDIDGPYMKVGVTLMIDGKPEYETFEGIPIDLNRILIANTMGYGKPALRKIVIDVLLKQCYKLEREDGIKRDIMADGSIDYAEAYFKVDVVFAVDGKTVHETYIIPVDQDKMVERGSVGQSMKELEKDLIKGLVIQGGVFAVPGKLELMVKQWAANKGQDLSNYLAQVDAGKIEGLGNKVADLEGTPTLH